MAEALLAVRLVLAAVFVTAGLSKLRDLEGSREAVRQFGVPAPVAGVVGTLLPITELAVAGALLPAGTAWFGALAALVLLLGFTGGIATALARGRQPDCHCFGQLHSSPVSRSTLARNIALTALAAVALAGSLRHTDVSAVSWISALSTGAALGLAGALAFALILAAQVWFWFALLQQNARLLLRLETIEGRLGIDSGTPEPIKRWKGGLAVGSRAPDFELRRLDGGRSRLATLLERGRPVMLVFTDPKCGPCNALVPDLARWQGSVQSLTIVPVSSGAPEDNADKLENAGVEEVLLQEGREVAELYRAGGTPSAVLVDREGRVASPLAGGAGRIRALVEYATSAPLAVTRVPAGSAGASAHLSA